MMDALLDGAGRDRRHRRRRPPAGGSRIVTESPRSSMGRSTSRRGRSGGDRDGRRCSWWRACRPRGLRPATAAAPALGREHRTRPRPDTRPRTSAVPHLATRRIWRRSSGNGSGRCWDGTTSTSTHSGRDRWLWLFQDAFIDHPGSATGLDGVGFAQNAALVQSGTCFVLYHRGTAAQPSSFEPGDGEIVLSRWWWPLGGELEGGVLRVFWAEMVHDPVDPPAGDGLPWHPVRTWLATYDAVDLTRIDFTVAPGPGRRQYRAAGALRVRRRVGRHPHLPVRQHLPAEPDGRRRVLERSPLGHGHVAGAGAEGSADLSATVLDRVGMEHRSRQRPTDPAALLDREPHAAPLHRRPLDRSDEGERLLGRPPGRRHRHPAMGSMDHRPGGRCDGPRRRSAC